jgi:hypothetical protein
LRTGPRKHDFLIVEITETSGESRMQNTVTDNVRSLFAGRGIDIAKAGDADLAIDRFDNWTNRAGGQVMDCFTGVCTVAPPLAEAS